MCCTSQELYHPPHHTVVILSSFLVGPTFSWHELWQPPCPVGLSHTLPFLMSLSRFVALNILSIITAFMVLHQCCCSGLHFFIHKTVHQIFFCYLQCFLYIFFHFVLCKPENSFKHFIFFFLLTLNLS